MVEITSQFIQKYLESKPSTQTWDENDPRDSILAHALMDSGLTEVHVNNDSWEFVWDYVEDEDEEFPLPEWVKSYRRDVAILDTSGGYEVTRQTALLALQKYLVGD